MKLEVEFWRKFEVLSDKSTTGALPVVFQNPLASLAVFAGLLTSTILGVRI